MLTELQIERYARHILLPELGGTGQERLMASRVLIVGAGGLGAPLVQYLAAAGVGRLTIIDDDRVDLSNLQRQVIHRTADIGRPKAARAAEAALEINPEIAVAPIEERLGPGNVAALVAEADVVADATDNFEARYLLNDACVVLGRPLVSAALLRFEAQLSTWRGHEAGHPCYRCLFPEPPPPGTVPSCTEAGVMGALVGMVGAQQAMEVVKEATGIGRSLAGRLLLIDGLEAESREITVPKDPDCPVCAHAAAQPAAAEPAGG